MPAAQEYTDKVLKVLTRTLVEILKGESTYREESLKLKRLGMETGPDLEDLLLNLATRWPSFEQDLPALLQTVGMVPLPVASALLELLAGREAVAALVAIRDEGKGELRKPVGAALQRLRTKGVVVPEPLALQPRTLPSLPLEVYASLSGMAGGRTLIWFVPARAQQPEASYVVQWSEAENTLEVQLTTSELRSLRQTAQQYCQTPFPETMSLLKPGHGLALLEEWMALVREQHGQLSFELIWLVQDLKQLLGVTSEPYRPQGVESFVAQPFMTADEVQLLLSHHEVFMWTPGEKVLFEMLGQLMSQEPEESRVLLSPEAEQERERERHRRWLKGFYTASQRHRLARRMEEHCQLWEQRGEHGLVKQVWELALAVRSDHPVEEISFMEVFFEANLGALMQVLQQELLSAGKLSPELMGGGLSPELLGGGLSPERSLPGAALVGGVAGAATPSSGPLIVGTGRDWTPSDATGGGSRLILP